MLNIVNLRKTFRRRHALDGVSFDVADGEKVALMGPNGAGKSTLLRILASVIPPTSGSVRIDGAETLEAPPESRVGIGYMAEGAPIYPDMRVAEYLKFAGRLRGMRGAHLNRRLHDVIALCDLTTQRKTIIDRLSNGERRRVALAAALLHEPHLLILDDPTAGLDDYHTLKIAAVISGEELENTTVIFATHSRDFADIAAKRVIALSAGKTPDKPADAIGSIDSSDTPTP